jgi:serine/threonine protein kinase
MCCGKRLAEDWTSEDWWKSLADSSNSVSVETKVKIHLKEFLSCVKVLRIAIAEAKCNFKFDLSTIKDSEVLMSEVFKGYENTPLEHIDASMQKFTSSEDRELAKHLKERFDGQLSIKFPDVHIDYKNGRLGEGSSGMVCKCNFLGREAAAKIFGRCQDSSRKDVKNEVNLLARLQHPNVVQLIGHTFNETQEVIVLERMEANLENYLTSCMQPNKEGPPLPLLGAVDIMLHIAEGMNYLHENHVVHRDLKARNVLISTVVKDVENLERSWAWHVKITDFGLSKLKEGSQYSTLDVGTRAFMAPEVFNVEDNKDKNYTKAADVYSYAMIFFEVLTGKVPFEGVPRGEIFERIKKGERPNLPSEAYCPEYLSAFIRRCWATETEERPEFPDICQMLVYCKELILRDSFPSPLICIVENDAQKLSSFLGPKCCFEKVYSFMVFAAYNNGDHRPDRIVEGRMKLDWIQAQVKAGKHFGNWINQWRDFDKAFKLFSNAAKHKDPEALCRLGLCFEYGLGTEHNHQEAVRHYQLAITGEYASAYVELSCCYALGRGVPQSDDQAMNMLEKALEQQTSAGIVLPCVTEMLQYMDPSKIAAVIVPPAILEGHQRARNRYLLITKFPIGRKLLAGPGLNNNQEVDIISIDVHKPKSKGIICGRSFNLGMVGFLLFSTFVVTSLLSVHEVQHFFVAIDPSPFLVALKAAQDFLLIFLSRSFAIVLFSFERVDQLAVFCFALTSTVFAVWVCVQWAINLLKAKSPPDSTAHPFHMFPPVLRLVTNSYVCLPTCVGFLLFCTLMFWSWPTAWLILQCSIFHFVITSFMLCWDFFSMGFFLLICQGFVKLRVQRSR